MNNKLTINYINVSCNTFVDRNNMDKKNLIYATILLVFIDQLTKWLFEGKYYFDNFLISIKSTANKGSAFSLFSNIDIYNYLILSFSIIVLIAIIYYITKIKQNAKSYLIIIFFISGLIGNFIDRISYGYVRDFISIKYLFIFNIADVYLTLAAILLILYEVSENKTLKTKNSKRN